jgi:hypothetical protein
MVSAASELSVICLAGLLVAALGVAACGGRQHPVTQPERGENAMTNESRTDTLQFDNLATIYVDVYLACVSRELQWRLGRVLPGMRVRLRVPESVIDQRCGLVQVAVIPGSQMAAEAWLDPQAIIATAQPMSEVLSQRWTFRQPTGAPLQLQSTRLTGR